MSAFPVSNTQLNKCADRLMGWWRDPSQPPALFENDPELGRSLGIVLDFRATFQRPLDKVTIQLRRFVENESYQVIAAQRLKRMPTILDKLDRHPNMDLTRMQDIGGCRAVLAEATAVQAVLERIVKHWKVERIFDYVTTPKPTGYRAVHVVVNRDGRLIEIQLRTIGQHDWAVSVERVGGILGVPVKDGEGPPDVLRYFELAAWGIALQGAGDDVDASFQKEFVPLAQRVQELVRKGRTD